MTTTTTNSRARRGHGRKKEKTPGAQGKRASVAQKEDSVLSPSAFLAMPVESSQIKYLISERPELLEPELNVSVDAEGNQCGVGFETEVGEIDLLARSLSGDWVVVMVAGSDGATDPIPSMLQRLGWVQKHLCGSGQITRGILLVDRMDETTRYAAAALADSVDFVTWRMSLQFEPMPS